jgi:hypothetical protein
MMTDWQPIATAPKDRYFLAYVMGSESERKLYVALGFPEPGGQTIVAHKRKGDPKIKVRGVPRGELHTATHWMDLPKPPKDQGL